jgi:hypothetical protein
MVDPRARIKLATALRRLATRRTTNRQFEAEVDVIARSDTVVRAILEECWYWYDDLSEHKLRLAPEARRLFARCYVFLRSSLEYEYSTNGRIMRLLLLLLDLPTLALASSLGHRERCLAPRAPSLWPFRRAADLASASTAVLARR